MGQKYFFFLILVLKTVRLNDKSIREDVQSF